MTRPAHRSQVDCGCSDPQTSGDNHAMPEIPKQRRPRRDRMTIAELCEDLDISRSTFYDWRAKGRAPRCIKLPNGEIRIRRADYERWLDSLEEAA